jgi:uncharacterized protein
VTLVSFFLAAILGVPVGLALGLVGGGGSILTVPILIGVLGLEPKIATSVSLLIVAVNAVSALRGYVRQKLVQYRMAITLTMAGLLGSYAGTTLNHLLSPRVLTLTFVGLMVLIATLMFRPVKKHQLEALNAPEAVTLPRLVGAGTLIGLITGFFGVGGGFIIVPVLLTLGLPMRQAVPTSLLVIALNSLVALGLRVLSGRGVPLEYALPMILGGILGSSLAVLIAPRLGNRGLGVAFGGLILVMAGFLLFTTLQSRV